NHQLRELQLLVEARVQRRLRRQDARRTDVIAKPRPRAGSVQILGLVEHLPRRTGRRGSARMIEKGAVAVRARIRLRHLRALIGIERAGLLARDLEALLDPLVRILEGVEQAGGKRTLERRLGAGRYGLAGLVGKEDVGVLHAPLEGRAGLSR